MKSILKKFLTAYSRSNRDELLSLINDYTQLRSNMVGNAIGKEIVDKLKLPMDNINVSIITITNYIEQDYFCIATFHHMHALDDNQTLYPFIYGGKISLKVRDNIIQAIDMDLEYEYGNTYMMKDYWNLFEAGKKDRYVSCESLNLYAYSAEEAVYKFFLSLDIMDEKLLQSNITDDIMINRVGVNTDVYKYIGVQGTLDFMKFDKEYFEQNQYSLHIHSIDFIDDCKTHMVAWHLSPGKPGNKHIASHTKFSQFYNEIIDIIVVKEGNCYKVQNVNFKRKENPVQYGYEYIEL